MSHLLKPSQVVTTESAGLPCVVESFLGGGGQGEVYRALYAGEPVALKWYFAQQASREQHQALDRLIQIGAPTDRFLWPLELVGDRTLRGFGYIMPLRDPRYKSIVDLMTRRTEPRFRSLITAAVDMADSFLQLHARGLCYRDISFGNVFFDPDSGEALICDNDNVAINGSARIGVLGTPRFMAPEVVRCEAAPSIQTDLYSLSVLLFYLLMVHHPLEGRREAAIRCMDLPAMNRLYGEQPLFIFDPDDDSNAPLPSHHENALAFWPVYPLSVRNLFTRAFTTGLAEPMRRVRESEWRAGLVRIRDHIFYCACGQENFHCPAQDSEPARNRTCWSCDAALVLPARLRIGDHSVMLNSDTQLYPHHTEPDRRYDFSMPIAAVVENPARPGDLGLQNRSRGSWRLTQANGMRFAVDPGRTVRITSGSVIDFGRVSGELIV